MNLPHASAVVIPEEKITGYLLSPTHRDGRHKAAFFSSLGFSAERWPELADALKDHAQTHAVTHEEPSPFGTRYVVEGIMKTPTGRTPLIRVVWFVETGEAIPRLTTAYPLKGKQK